MSLFLAYKTKNSVSLDNTPGDKPKYVLFRDEDIKMGLIVPSSNPMIASEASFEINARNRAEAEKQLSTRREPGLFV